MTSETGILEAVVRKVPSLANAKELEISFLAGGITNKNYKIQTDKETFVLRVPGEKTELHGINRAREASNQTRAAELGVAPAVIAFIQPEGYLLSQFVSGEKLSLEMMRERENIDRVAKKIHTIHEGPKFDGIFDVFRVCENYLALARVGGAALPKNIVLLEKFARDIERALYYQNPLLLQPIHADLLNENFLLRGENLWILDWEYSGMGDIFFDLANFSDHHQFAENEEHLLLLSYFGKFDESAVAKLKLMRIMSDFREALWGVAQTRLSTLDFDFKAYAHEFFERMFVQATDPRYPGWLLTATGLKTE